MNQFKLGDLAQTNFTSISSIGIYMFLNNRGLHVISTFAPRNFIDLRNIIGRINYL